MPATVQHPHHLSLHHDPGAAALALAASEEALKREEAKAKQSQARIYLVGRLMLGAFFLVLGADKLIHFRTEARALFDLDITDPEIPLGLAMILELVAGALIALGYATRKVSIAVIVYLVGNALMAWAYIPHQWAQVIVLVNFGVIGAMLLLNARGAGIASIDTWREKKLEGN